MWLRWDWDPDILWCSLNLIQGHYSPWSGQSFFVSWGVVKCDPQAKVSLRSKVKCNQTFFLIEILSSSRYTFPIFGLACRTGIALHVKCKNPWLRGSRVLEYRTQRTWSTQLMHQLEAQWKSVYATPKIPAETRTKVQVTAVRSLWANEMTVIQRNVNGRPYSPP